LVESCSMSLQFAAAITGVFLLAGFVKGVVGLGLPTVSIGLLATAMPPSHAAAIVVVPAIITNIWQSFAGPYFRPIVKRLWPLFAGTCIGTWSAADLMTAQYAKYGVVILGLLLLSYAFIGLKKLRFVVSPLQEKWIGGFTGLTTGIICAATGVQVVPSTPYLQAIGLEKDELVQALGLFFTIATLALAFNLTNAGLLNDSTACPAALGLGFAFVGMFIGQAVRSRMDAAAFRRWFLMGMASLGFYLATTAIFSLTLNQQNYQAIGDDAPLSSSLSAYTDLGGCRTTSSPWCYMAVHTASRMRCCR
jgi:uncharacterized protein